ncbi:MAG: AmmeMemoRadiSam system protein B [Treponema sp.]|jgi:AmmeMemoRadiSam system protein B|nr:AmmeMemoRadiSam system protein B [Treponema sp.]
MNIREPALSPGWYPRSAEAINRFLEQWKDPAPKPRNDSPGGSDQGDGGGLAALSPHAGWYYSGAVAATAAAFLDREAETVVILGGHLAARSPVLAYTEDGFSSPLGPVIIDRELRESLCSVLEHDGPRAWGPDRSRDNTVEVLIPMVRFFFPQARILALRLPADSSSYNTGMRLAEAAKALGRRLAVIGSTDLTHYGRNYGFSPQGQGSKALAWVRQINDRRFLDAVLTGDPAAVLTRAEEERSACSAGAVLGVLGFVREYAPTDSPVLPELLAYATSVDAEEGGIPDSFVGYAAVGWK